MKETLQLALTVRMDETCQAVDTLNLIVSEGEDLTVQVRAKGGGSASDTPVTCEEELHVPSILHSLHTILYTLYYMQYLYLYLYLYTYTYPILYYTMLCYVMRCCTILYYAMPCYAMLYGGAGVPGFRHDLHHADVLTGGARV